MFRMLCCPTFKTPDVYFKIPNHNSKQQLFQKRCPNHDNGVQIIKITPQQREAMHTKYLFHKQRRFDNFSNIFLVSALY